MKKNDALLKEAIADAKAVQETALENAKLALQEAFVPQLQSMLNAKLQTEMEDAVDEEDYLSDDPSDEGSDISNPTESNIAENEDEIDDVEDAIDAVEDELDDVDDAYDDDMGGEAEIDVDDEIEEMATDEMEDEVEDDEMSDFELESIIKELDAEIDEEIEEQADTSAIGKGAAAGSGTDNKQPKDQPDIEDPQGTKVFEGDDVDEAYDMPNKQHDEYKKEKDMDEDVDINEIMAALEEDDSINEMDDEVEDDESNMEDEMAESAAALEEAYNVISFLKGKINEMNLLNSKLLFANRIFRSYPLTESQKLKVIEGFDRTKTVREVKLIYTALMENFSNITPKGKMTEGASKASKSTAPKKENIIAEGNDIASRFKKLAKLG